MESYKILLSLEKHTEFKRDCPPKITDFKYYENCYDKEIHGNYYYY